MGTIDKKLLQDGPMLGLFSSIAQEVAPHYAGTIQLRYIGGRWGIEAVRYFLFAPIKRSLIAEHIKSPGNDKTTIVIHDSRDEPYVTAGLEKYLSQRNDIEIDVIVVE